MSLPKDKNFKFYVIDVKSSIEEAWAVIEENNHRSAIVVEEGKVVGTLSDGDLRKAMLSNRLLSTPVAEVMNVHFIFVREDNKEDALKLMTDKNIFIVPVVDESMTLLEIIVTDVRCMIKLHSLGNEGIDG